MGICQNKPMMERVVGKDGARMVNHLSGKDKGKGKREPPAPGDVIYIERYGEMGTVKRVDVDEARIYYTEPGRPDGDEDDCKLHTDDWKKASDVPALAPFLPSMEVTATHRGSKVNGWVVGDKGSKGLEVKFLPDAAHDKVDKTHWKLGGQATVKDATPGHTGAKRPRNRNKSEMDAEHELCKFAGIVCLHCCSCGKGIWEDPCDCYVTRRRKGYYCVECGSKGSGPNSRCCGRAVNDGPQNQGWINTLANQYGHFD